MLLVLFFDLLYNRLPIFSADFISPVVLNTNIAVMLLKIIENNLKLNKSNSRNPYCLHITPSTDIIPPGAEDEALDIEG